MSNCSSEETCSQHRSTDSLTIDELLSSTDEEESIFSLPSIEEDYLPSIFDEVKLVPPPSEAQLLHQLEEKRYHVDGAFSQQMIECGLEEEVTSLSTSTTTSAIPTSTTTKEISTSPQLATNLNLLDHKRGLQRTSVRAKSSETQLCDLSLAKNGATNGSILGAMKPNDVHNNKEMVELHEIGENDVICERGGRANGHVGNKRYRAMIMDYRKRYKSINRKRDKVMLSQSLTDEIHRRGGRFLKRVSPGRDACPAVKYEPIPYSKARLKTSQALRESKEMKRISHLSH